MANVKSNLKIGEYMEINFCPNWSYISSCRHFVHDFLNVSLMDKSKADKGAMVASELLENATKYSIDTETYMIVSLEEKEKKVSIQVKNRTTDEHMNILKKLLSNIKKQDPLKAYLAQMRKASEKDSQQSQLGLVRIIYEAEAEIFLKIRDKNEIIITAVM